MLPTVGGGSGSTRLWGQRLGLFLFPGNGPKRTFYRSLARLLHTGGGVDDALRKLSARATGRVKVGTQAVLTAFLRGDNLAVALGEGPWEYRPIEAALVNMGLQGGRLPDVLFRLADMEDVVIANRRAFLSRLAYPVALMFLACFLLPVSALMSGGTAAYAAAVLARLGTLVAGLLAVWPLYRGTGMVWQRLLGAVSASRERHLAPARLALFYRGLSESLASGASTREALLLGRAVWSSRHARTLVEQGVQELDAGEHLHSILEPLVPESDLVVVLSGEESGTLEEVFLELSKTHQERADRRMRLVVAVGAGLVGLLVLAMLAIDIASTLHQQIMPSLEGLEGLPQFQELEQEWRGVLKPIPEQ